MIRKVLYSVFAMFLITMYAAVPVNAAEPSAKEVNKQKTTAYETLFFMNPHGRPCQYQNQILNEIGETVNSVAPVRYYKTTDQSDHQAFRTYGVRGLPTLMIIDKEGNTVHRFSPGVQSKETILAALKELNK